jgi:hypothetical protein
MSRLGLLLTGFLLVIVGMVMFGFAPGLGRWLMVAGALLVWGAMAVALDDQPWTSAGKRLLQVFLGASVLAVVATAIAPDLTGIIVAAGVGATLGAIIGILAPQWRRWLNRSTLGR